MKRLYHHLTLQTNIELVQGVKCGAVEEENFPAWAQLRGNFAQELG
jgi:hypothetical protein